MDTLRIAIAKLTMLMERQLNYLLNSSLNGILPSFVNLGKLGLNFGMQGAQFTATSTTAENQTLATPIYTHSIPNTKDNRSEEHTSELQSLMRTSYAVFCLTKTKNHHTLTYNHILQYKSTHITY